MKVIKTSTKSIAKAKAKDAKQKEQHEAVLKHDQMQEYAKQRQKIDFHHNQASRALACEMITNEEFDAMAANMNAKVIMLLKLEAELEGFDPQTIKDLYL